jgi:hypothetical protein
MVDGTTREQLLSKIRGEGRDINKGMDAAVLVEKIRILRDLCATYVSTYGGGDSN